MKDRRNRTPSRAVKEGAPLGASLGMLLEVGALIAGHPLPDGTGAALGGSLATVFAFFWPGGRQGEAD
jgi:hypothetical protein